MTKLFHAKNEDKRGHCISLPNTSFWLELLQFLPIPNNGHPRGPNAVHYQRNPLRAKTNFPKNGSPGTPQKASSQALQDCHGGKKRVGAAPRQASSSHAQSSNSFVSTVPFCEQSCLKDAAAGFHASVPKSSSDWLRNDALLSSKLLVAELASELVFSFDTGLVQDFSCFVDSILLSHVTVHMLTRAKEYNS
nr:hypothetical protein Iba_scaffold10327CG0190 [Ipomoea batatas]